MRRGEVWWADLPPPQGRRPLVLVSREQAYLIREAFIAAIVTTRARRLPSEVPVGRVEGLRKPSVVNCDVLETVKKRQLVNRTGQLSPAKMIELDEALRFALGL